MFSDKRTLAGKDLTSQRLVRPSNFQNAPFAAVRNAWSTTRALLPSLGAIANRAACASLTDYQSFFCAPTSSHAQAGTFASPLPPTHQPGFVQIPRLHVLCRISLLWARTLSCYICRMLFSRSSQLLTTFSRACAPIPTMGIN